MLSKSDFAPIVLGQLGRRLFAGAMLLAIFSLTAPSSALAGELHDQPWFKPTTGDLRRDLAAAEAEGKRLALIWEQIGCSYCAKMHDVNFKKVDIVQLITNKFYPVQLNMRSSKKITDFDGVELSQAGVARKHGINGTPQIEFRDGTAEEVFRLPGYAEPLIFKGVFDYVASKGYEEQELIPWLKANYLNQGERKNDG